MKGMETAPYLESASEYSHTCMFIVYSLSGMNKQNVMIYNGYRRADKLLVSNYVAKR